MNQLSIMYMLNDQYNEMVNFGGNGGNTWRTNRYMEPCDDYMNIDDIGDAGYYSMFKKTVVRSDQEILEDVMKKCMDNRSKDLKITGKNINEIPNGLSEFDWLETLTIEHSGIHTLNNLPPNIKELVCQYNKINILDGSTIPDSVNILTFTHNYTIEVVGLKEGIIELNLSSNKLKQINCKIPSTVTTLNVSSNSFLNELPQFGDNLRVFNMAHTLIYDINDINDNVQILDSCNCHINKVNKLPKDLIIWKSYSSNISEIECEFPLNLTELDLFNNCLSEIPDLPDTIKSVDLNKNELQKIPKFPFTAESVDLKNNPKLDVKLLEEIEKSMIDGKLSYDMPRTEFRYQNYNNYNNFNKIPKNMFRNNFGLPISSENYSESNPHYIPLYKTYCLD